MCPWAVKPSLPMRRSSHVSTPAGVVWIVKPSGRNRGNGIEVVGSFIEIEKHLRLAK